jgi:hypothetical protein
LPGRAGNSDQTAPADDPALLLRRRQDPLDQPTSAQLREADIIEEWCIERGDDGVSLDDATVEINIWLTGTVSASAPRNRLEDPKQRSAVGREVRICL